METSLTDQYKVTYDLRELLKYILNLKNMVSVAYIDFYQNQKIPNIIFGRLTGKLNKILYETKHFINENRKLLMEIFSKNFEYSYIIKSLLTNLDNRNIFQFILIYPKLININKELYNNKIFDWSFLIQDSVRALKKRAMGLYYKDLDLILFKKSSINNKNIFLQAYFHEMLHAVGDHSKKFRIFYHPDIFISEFYTELYSLLLYKLIKKPKRKPKQSLDILKQYIDEYKDKPNILGNCFAIYLFILYEEKVLDIIPIVDDRKRLERIIEQKMISTGDDKFLKNKK